jgi:tryptophanyl-tRNA synthetase
VPGLDGQKMSKSYGNVIPLFASHKELKKIVMSIVSSSEPLEAPKEPEGTTLFTLFKYVAGDDKAAVLAEKLRAGGYGWGHAKLDLLAALEDELGPLRERYLSLRSDEAKLDALLAEGAARARVIARATMERVRDATGIARKN